MRTNRLTRLGKLLRHIAVDMVTAPRIEEEGEVLVILPARTVGAVARILYRMAKLLDPSENECHNPEQVREN